MRGDYTIDKSKGKWQNTLVDVMWLIETRGKKLGRERGEIGKRMRKEDEGGEKEVRAEWRLTLTHRIRGALLYGGE
jgi:hypothetical protein